jgi:Fic-DOC domain mobile mystery protein B
MVFKHIEGATPLSPDDIYNLLPNHLTIQSELNEWEQLNIVQAEQWAFQHKRKNILTIEFAKLLHKKMFDATWQWAGQFRTRQTNIGVESREIAHQLRFLFNDTAYYLKENIYSIKEIATRLHHKLVWVHPFPNGNGRFSRLFADLFLDNLGEQRFSWGGSNLSDEGLVRKQYLAALKLAENYAYTELLKFVES